MATCASLLFDCEVLAATTSAGSEETHFREARICVQTLERYGRPTTVFGRQIRDIVGRHLARADPADVEGLAATIAANGYDVSVRTTLPGNAGADCFKSLRHSFLVVRGSGEFAGMEFLVEPTLRAHFTIPHPSPDYEHVLSRTPDVFVGGSCRLVPIVQLLCALMADSFERQGLALPPWRKEAAMLSKWLPAPNRLRDTPVLPAGIIAGLVAPLSLPFGEDAHHTFDVRDFSTAANVVRTDSSTSTDSNITDHDYSTSPVSVLPEALQTLSPKRAAICSIHGFEPAAASFSSALEASGTSPPVPLVGSSSGGGSGRGSGLLAAKLHEPRPPTIGAGSGGDTFRSSCIQSRPPTHQGEMTIRVVKLVGFNVPEQQQQPHRQNGTALMAVAAANKNVNCLPEQMLPWRRDLCWRTA